MASVAEALLFFALVAGCAGLGGASPDAEKAARLEREGKYEEASRARQAIVAATEAKDGSHSVALAVALSNLVNDELYLAESGQMFEHKDTHAGFEEARTNALRALAIEKAALGPNDARFGLIDQQLGIIARFEGHPEEALAFFEEARTIYQNAYGQKDLHVADILWEIAELDETTLKFDDEEHVLKEELALREGALGADSLRVAQSLDHVGNFEFNRRGRYDLAEDYAKRSLAIREKLLSPDDAAIAESLLGLALVYQRQRRFEEALPLVQRAIAIRQKRFGANSKELAIGLNILAGIYDGLDRLEDERQTLVAMEALFREQFGDQDPDVASALTQRGDLERRAGRPDAARKTLEEAAAIEAHQPVRGNPTRAVLDLDFAKLELDAHRYRDAEAAASEALAIYEPMTGPAYPDRILTYDLLGEALLGEDRITEAYEESNRALEGLAERALTAGSGRTEGDLSERRGARQIFLHHLEIASALAKHSPARRAALEAETFQVAQLAQASSTAEAVAGMAARFAARDDALAAIIRQKQDAQARWRQLDGLLISASGAREELRDHAREAAMRTELAALDRELRSIDLQIADQFPGYAEIANPAPRTLRASQALLRPAEAMLVYMVGEKETTFWALTPAGARMFQAPIGADALANEVIHLRQALDPSQLSIDTPADIPRFDVAAAWTLYQQIVAPAEGLIGQAQVLYIVPDRALESLPFGVLVTAKPPVAVTDFAGYRKMAWLADRYATTVLPSVSSLSVLRTFARPSRAPSPFLGIGDPTLAGSLAGARGKKVVGLFRGGTADVETVRSLPALPESAKELASIAEELGASQKDLVLGDRARKPAVVKLDFSHYRIVTFATHGLVAGELTGLAEPALVLTPPPVQKGTEDDGLLKASDVSALQFDADWVVLSACNTAAGDGSLDAEGLSGLAKAFFYAGSRTLLVSHWPVFSESTVRLTTGTFAEIARDPSTPRAIALKRAMDALRADDSQPYFAHPMFWAPFVVVGEGGGS